MKIAGKEVHKITSGVALTFFFGSGGRFTVCGDNEEEFLASLSSVIDAAIADAAQEVASSAYRSGWVAGVDYERQRRPSV